MADLVRDIPQLLEQQLEVPGLFRLLEPLFDLGGLGLELVDSLLFLGLGAAAAAVAGAGSILDLPHPRTLSPLSER
jgi:hypothetical protein